MFFPTAEQEEKEEWLHPLQRFRSDLVAKGKPRYENSYTNGGKQSAVCVPLYEADQR